MNETENTEGLGATLGAWFLAVSLGSIMLLAGLSVVAYAVNLITNIVLATLLNIITLGGLNVANGNL